MNGPIAHCPNCGAALTTNARVSEASVVNTAHNNFVQIRFEVEQVDHDCGESA